MNRRGFSLIELILVLILIGLSVALVSPSLSRFSQRIELKTTAQKISGILRYFRNESIQKGKVYQVLFDPDQREVRVQAVDEEGETGEENPDHPERFQKRYLLPQGIQMKEVKIPTPQYPAGLPAIEFYPNGGSNGGSLLLETQEPKGYRIRVHFLTGIVEIEGA